MSLINKNIWTIGHSKLDIENFIQLLKDNSIEVVADVRTIPNSKMAPQFNQNTLKNSLERHGINYIFMGKELGGRPDEDYMYDVKGHVLYNKLAESDLFKKGIDRLKSGILKYRIVLMCSEGKPETCHRNLLIARVLSDSNVNVLNILTNGSLISYNELKVDSKQLTLIEIDGGESWKSVLSVRQASQQNNFLEH